MCKISKSSLITNELYLVVVENKKIIQIINITPRICQGLIRI